MPGLEPGIQAAPSLIIKQEPALDARIKPVHDETEGAAVISGRRHSRSSKAAGFAGRRAVGRLRCTESIFLSENPIRCYRVN